MTLFEFLTSIPVRLVLAVLLFTVTAWATWLAKFRGVRGGRWMAIGVSLGMASCVFYDYYTPLAFGFMIPIIFVPEAYFKNPGM